MVMPQIALAPDISGVCSVVGTRPMSSKPTKVASDEDDDADDESASSVHALMRGHVRRRG